MVMMSDVAGLWEWCPKCRAVWIDGVPAHHRWCPEIRGTSETGGAPETGGGSNARG